MAKIKYCEIKGGKSYSPYDLLEIFSRPLDEIDDDLQDPDTRSATLKLLNQNKFIRKRSFSYYSDSKKNVILKYYIF